MEPIEILDTIRAEFEDPASRTVRRLRALYASTIAAAVSVNLTASELFADVPDGVFGGPEVRAAWQAEFLGLLARLESYRGALVPEGAEPADLSTWGAIDPDAIAPEVYRGLVAGRTLAEPDGLGAGPVPDAAMPASLARRLALLDEHAETTTSGGQLVADVLDELREDLATAAKATAKTIAGIAYATGETLDNIADTAIAARDRAIGLVVGAVIVGGSGWLLWRLWKTRKAAAALLVALLLSSCSASSWQGTGRAVLADVLACGGPQLMRVAAGGQPDYAAAAACHAERVAERLREAPPDQPPDTGRQVVEAAEASAAGDDPRALDLARECEARAREVIRAR